MSGKGLFLALDEALVRQWRVDQRIGRRPASRGRK